MPSLRRFPQELVQTPPWTFRVHSAQGAASSQKLDEPVKARVLSHEVPVEPTGFIVLAVGVVVPALAPPRPLAARLFCPTPSARALSSDAKLRTDCEAQRQRVCRQRYPPRSLRRLPQ